MGRQKGDRRSDGHPHQPGSGIWGPHCTPAANAPSRTAGTGRAASSPAAPRDAVLFSSPTVSPAQRGHRGERGGSPPAAFSPPPNSGCKVLSREQRRERSPQLAGVPRPPSPLPLGRWGPASSRRGKIAQRQGQVCGTFGVRWLRCKAQSDGNGSEAAFTAHFPSNYRKTR